MAERKTIALGSKSVPEYHGEYREPDSEAERGGAALGVPPFPECCFLSLSPGPPLQTTTMRGATP